MNKIGPATHQITGRSKKLPGQPHQLDVALGFSFQTSARLDAVEIAVDVDLQLSRPASIGTLKAQIDQVEFVDKDVDYAHRIGIADVVVEALGK